MYTIGLLGDEFAAVWHHGTEATDVVSVTRSPCIRALLHRELFIFIFMSESLLHNNSV